MFRVVRLISTGVSSLVGLRQTPKQKALAGLIFNSHRSCLSSMAATLSSDKIKAVHDDIVKSAEDKRSYRGLVLNNDMKVFLVSDPTTDKSSAALDVNIGSMSDPSELPGLAHFCEHMLFLGTEKYPEENEYNKFLSEHGGSSNAFTSGEHTNYFFDVAPEHLDGALDRFAQFFLCPLFTASATDREVNAVNSENDKNIPNDSWRLFQLEKSTADPNHAYCRFSTGNKETLDVIPKQNGLDVREELLKFHKKFYSSNLMGICILGKESLDELTDMVVPLFSGVENKNVPVPEWKEHPYGPEQLKLMGSVVPIKDIRSLNVTWPIPDLHPYYKCNPGHYLGHLIGHEGPGSLLSELKSRGWVNQLLGGQKSGGNGFMFFIVNVDLSEEGIDHVDDIVTLIFQYLNMLRQEGPQGWVFKECQDLNAMQFRFKDKEKPRNYTCQIAGCLPDYPIKEILSASMLLGEFKPELIDMVLDCLTPDRIRVAVISQHFAGKTDQKEKWYGTEYSLKSISEETIQKWKDADVHENLKLPLRNEFIPTDFEICERDKEPSTLPHVIRDTAMTRMWYKQDDKFLLPKCCISLELTSPYAYMDPLSTNLTYMFTSLFQDALTEFAYDAELAGLNYDLHNTIYGLTLGFRGYSDKMHILLKKVIEKMTSFKVDAQRFELLKDNYVRALKNFRAEQPHQHAVYFCSVLTSELMWTKEELLDATEELTVERVQAFIPQVLSRLYLEFLVYGNTSREKAEEIGNMVENMLQTKAQTKPLLPSQQKRFREVQMPDGCYYVYKRSNDVHRSSSLEVYYQCNIQDTHTNMVLELFCQIISEPCFDILRTQEQLGYIVFSGVRRSHGIQGLRVIVQSDKTPEYVEGRIEAFLHKMESHIAEISQESFDNHIEALATKRLEKPKKMSTQNARYWSEIISQLYNFERDDIEVNHLRTLKKEDILSFYKELIAHNAPKRHKLSVHVMSTLDDGKDNNKCDAPDGLASPPACIQASEIVDINDFKRGLGLFPLPKPFIDIQNTKSKL